MAEQLTADDLDRALFTVKNDEGERIVVSAKDATPQQFHKWATGYTLAEDSSEQWTPEDRAEFCNVPVKLNTKREALAMAARSLREHQREVWGQYKWSPQVQAICDEYYEVIHGIELQIVELDRQEQKGNNE